MGSYEWLACCAALLVACGPSTASSGEGRPDGQSGRVDAGDRPPPPSEFADAAPAAACEKMDIVFVVDNSLSMNLEQVNLAENFPMFANVLDTFVTAGGNPLDYRVAVTSTGVTKNWTVVAGRPGQVGADGELLQRCDMTRRWVERADPTAGSTFACAAELGIVGPLIEMPLEAIRLAFSDRLADGTNTGFLRDDALLAVVILTDEDDCSREDDDYVVGPDGHCAAAELAPVQPYKQFLDDVTGGPGRWAVAVVAGTGPGECMSQFGRADEATRLIEFAGLAGDNGVVGSICQGDLAAPLAEALATFDAACESFPPVD